MVVQALRSEVIDKLYIHEFFMINIAETVKNLENYMKDPYNMDPESELNQAIRELID